MSESHRINQAYSLVIGQHRILLIKKKNAVKAFNKKDVTNNY